MLVPAPALRNKGTNRAAVVSLVAAGTALSPAWAARWVRKPCGAAPGGVPSGADIVTKWGRLVDPTAGSPLPEYPRPQMVRSVDGWANLNGVRHRHRAILIAMEARQDCITHIIHFYLENTRTA